LSAYVEDYSNEASDFVKCGQIFEQVDYHEVFCLKELVTTDPQPKYKFINAFTIYLLSIKYNRL
jgi:hypothetical protein